MPGLTCSPILDTDPKDPSIQVIRIKNADILDIHEGKMVLELISSNIFRTSLRLSNSISGMRLLKKQNKECHL